MTPIQKPTSAPAGVPGQRRRLAANVICLFAEDRPPVPRMRQRGRYTGNVVPIWSKPRLKPGDIAELCRGALPENHGKRVRILAREHGADLPKGDWWKIESLAGPLMTRNLGPDGPDAGGAVICLCNGDHLRRIVEARH
jgi:hypothetical protein